MLLVEIHKPKIFKLNFSHSFLQIIVEIGEKYALNLLFNILEAYLASKNRKLKSAVVDPPLCYPLVVNVIFKLRFFLIFMHTRINMHKIYLFVRFSTDWQ